jgi:hypothetical protein
MTGFIERWLHHHGGQFAGYVSMPGDKRMASRKARKKRPSSQIFAAALMVSLLRSSLRQDASMHTALHLSSKVAFGGCAPTGWRMCSSSVNANGRVS